MSSDRMRWAGSAVLAATAVAAVIAWNGMRYQPAIPNAVPVAGGSVWLADADDDQLNEMEQQQAQQTAQNTQDISQQEQQIVDAQNAFDESMTAGNN